MNNKNPDAEDQTPEGQSRRRFLRKAVYASPVLLTLPAMPSFAQQGSAGVPGGDPGDDPGGGGPGSGEVDCDNPMQPIDSDIAVSMCRGVQDPVTGELSLQDIIVSTADVDVELANGSLFGTCDSIICSGS